MIGNAARFRDARYVGDGVYVGHDGYHLWVWTSNGFQESEPIALEPKVLAALVGYHDRLRAKPGDTP